MPDKICTSVVLFCLIESVVPSLASEGVRLHDIQSMGQGTSSKRLRYSQEAIKTQSSIWWRFDDSVPRSFRSHKAGGTIALAICASTAPKSFASWRSD